MLRIGQAAKEINVHPNTLRRWSDAGIIKVYRIGLRGDRRFRKEDIIEFLSNGNNSHL